jgi:gamma-glutamyltranspeptidase/glutathione hydrolase
MRLLFVCLFFFGCGHKVRIVAPTDARPKNNHESLSDGVMVASQGQATTKAALSVFKNGGNIIDAFVAASFAISVERPHSTGIGGGGFLLYFSKKDHRVYAFDFREVAPLAATKSMFLTSSGDPQPLLSQDGGLAVANPGLVRGLFEIHKRFGKLPWKDTVLPGIKLAREGFTLYPELKEALEDRRDLLLQDPEAKNTFYTKEGTTPVLGAIIYQENLARTLELIAEKGADGFYQGKVAHSIVNTIRKKNGLLSLRDLKSYKMVERSPVVSSYKGLEIYSMPPPSSGGIHVIQILKMLEPYKLKKIGPQTTRAVHLTASAMQRAFLDRALYLGDPDFNPVPEKELLSQSYLNLLSKSISSPKALKVQDVKADKLPYESSDTTHFTIADHEGNLVASTQTINGWFGSGVIAEGTGIILNNEMDDFAQKIGAQNLFGAVGGEHNLVFPKKRPLSSMSPTILVKEGGPFMALGSPSGTRIISCVAQTILNVVEFEMPLYEAVASTRIHHQWSPDALKIESPYLDPKVEEELQKIGHDVTHEQLGCSIQAIKRLNNTWHGVSDPRGEGLALGDSFP